jgi:hypothetical protein
MRRSALIPSHPPRPLTYKSPSEKFGIHDEAVTASRLHDADHGDANDCRDGCCVAFEVTSQAAIATESETAMEAEATTPDRAAESISQVGA